MERPTQSEIDAVLVECLRIFARRGRVLRDEREKAMRPDRQPTTVGEKANSNLPNIDVPIADNLRDTL